MRIVKLKGIVALSVMLAPGSGWAERTPQSVPLIKAGFERIAYKKGVAVYKHKTSDLIRLGADARINAPVPEVLKAVLDYPGQVGKIARLSESRVLRRGKNWLLVYQRLNLPVISDRDFTLLVRWGKRGDLTWVEYRTALRYGPPPRSGIVRVTRHEGSWQLKPARSGRSTQARFQVLIDMGGWLPRWLARSGSGKEVPEVFVSIRKMVFRPDYRSALCTSKCS